jgi:hypothetical protein
MNEKTESLESPPMTTPEQSKKVPPKGTPERRQYDRTAKQRSRSKAKQERLASQTPIASEYELPRSQKDQLAEHFRQIIARIAAELPHKLTFADECMIQMMADVVLAEERKWTRKVSSPNGMLYGSVFPDAAASDLIQHVHRFPNLLESVSFCDLYQTFLKLVHKLSRNDWFDQDFAKDIEAEINGTYSLPPEPQIPKAPEPALAIPEPPKLPTDQQVLAEGRARLLESLQGQLSPDARQYLYGGGR